MIPITCISAGPFIGIRTNGAVLVRSVVGDELQNPFVKAFLEDTDCGQIVLAWASLGITRDYRKAAIDDVCASLEREGKRFVKAL